MLQFDEYKVKLNNIKPALDELAQALNLNSGTVFRDLNSMYDARLLYIENRNGRNCYRTNYGMVQQVTEHIQRYLSGKE